MLYSTDRILTTHAGSLPRPADLREMVTARANGAPYDAEALAARLKSAVADVVRQQVECGLDCINDGELSKTNFTDYVRWRIAGYVERPSSGPRRLSITARDETKFADYFQTNPRARPVGPPTTPVCVEKLRYTGQGRGCGRHREPKIRHRRCPRCAGVSLRQHARHDRTLAGKRVLQKRRGIRLRHRRCHA